MDYAEIIAFFQEKNIKEMIKLINSAYKKLIKNFEEIDFGPMEKEKSIQLQERIECVEEKIREKLL